MVRDSWERVHNDHAHVVGERATRASVVTTTARGGMERVNSDRAYIAGERATGASVVTTVARDGVQRNRHRPLTGPGSGAIPLPTRFGQIDK